MLPLLTSDPCTSDEFFCRTAMDLWDNEQVAEAADVVIGTPLTIAGLVILGVVVRFVLHRMIDRIVRKAEVGVLPDRVGRISRGQGKNKASKPGGADQRDVVVATRRVQRAKAMGSLLKSVVTGIVVAVFTTMILAELSVDVAPIVASAGILGLALGFGAQSLVSDFLAGTFMIFEDQYGVGDEIDLGEAIGTVEAVSLRVTRLRDINGTVWYVRNGEITRVGNMSQNWARTVLDISVAYHEDLVKVRRVLQEVAHDLWDDEDFKGRIIEEPSVWGVQELGFDGVIIRVALKTAPLEQWSVAREMRERIKARFDYEGIEIPFPQRVVWHRGDESQPGAQPQDEQAGQPV
ncbi:mechanosensitive ion channel family protein [Nocardioides sp.]|uniref:mechanosensitive ion channel family protein n=1 Tax=Nocardioides sp. TaxID=35761 RepID=UPI002D803AC6|nr:mechanosensitive ion channel family protein [Nocardioides sp.]HET8960312.1 mechanosensitive ion channel family protein [Nocardioides sp.]